MRKEGNEEILKEFKETVVMEFQFNKDRIDAIFEDEAISRKLSEVVNSEEFKLAIEKGIREFRAESIRGMSTPKSEIISDILDPIKLEEIQEMIEENLRTNIIYKGFLMFVNLGVPLTSESLVKVTTLETAYESINFVIKALKESRYVLMI